MKVYLQFYLALSVILLGGCTYYRKTATEVVVLSYNVENLFDAIDDGNEYFEFTSRGGWTEAAYQQRLQQVGAAIRSIRPVPDIIVFQEIEKKSVLNTLMDEHVVDISVPYRAFTRGAQGSIGIGIVSRYPITAVRTLTPLTSPTSRMRPILEVTLDIQGEEVYVFGNHWRSKLGGAAVTEPIRRSAARLLNARILELWEENPDVAIILTGDFNSIPGELEAQSFQHPTALFPAEELLRIAEALADNERLYPWAGEGWFNQHDRILLAPDTVEAERAREALGLPVFINTWEFTDQPGSFNFFGRWEQIDAFYLTPSLVDERGFQFVGVETLCLLDGCDSDGRPRSWQDHSRGISDHLPLLLRLSLPSLTDPEVGSAQLLENFRAPPRISRW